MDSYLAFKRSFLPLTFSSLVCATANANPLDSLYVAPAVYYASPDSRLTADHDFGVQMSIGTYLSRQWQAELISEATKFKRDDGTDTYKQAGASVQAVFDPLDNLVVRPIFLGGAGFLHTSSNNAGSNNRALVRAGAGLQWQIPNSAWDIRGTATWRHEFNNGVLSPSSDLNTYIYSLGVSYRFGHSQSPHANQSTSLSTAEATHFVAAPISTTKQIATPPAPLNGSNPVITALDGDGDGDGVIDSQDKCPDTPQSAVVDADGCPMRMK